MNTSNFLQSELKCPCCNKYVPNVALLILLEDVRRFFNSPVLISSSTRCEKHNKDVGGSKGSWHLTGHAADITVKGVEPIDVYRYLNERPYSRVIGLGSYNQFTHVDTRGHKARW